MFTLLHVALLTCGLGASLLNQSLPYEKNNDNEYQLKYDNHKNVVYNDNNYSIRLDYDELNTYVFDNFYNWLMSNGPYLADRLNNVYIYTLVDGDYHEYDLEFQEFADGTQVQYGVNDLPSGYNEISFSIYENKDFYTYIDYDENSYEYDNNYPVNSYINFYCEDNVYNQVKTAIELDIQANQQPYSFDDVNYQITISADYLNNVYYKYLNDELVYNFTYYQTALTGTTATYNNVEYENMTIGKVEQNKAINLSYYNQISTQIYIWKYNWHYKLNNTLTDITESLTLNLNASTYANIKKYISKDFFAYENQTGTQIIGAIESGLGLVPDLASEFLTGFTNLFWNTTNEELTSFGIFALVFLGIAITMSVIALCLNILRRNTGA